MAFVTNLSEDRLLNYKIQYSCEEELYIGNKNFTYPNTNYNKAHTNRLILCGLGVEDRHARIISSAILKEYYNRNDIKE